MLSAQTRELAQDAGLTRLTGSRDDVDEGLRSRCRFAIEYLHREPGSALG